MAVGIQGLGSRGMPQPRLHGLDRLAEPDEQRRVVVTKRVHPGTGGFSQPGDPGGRSPDVPKRLAGDRASVEGEDQVLIAYLAEREMLVERLDDCRRQRDRPVARLRLQRSELGGATESG